MTTYIEANRDSFLYDEADPEESMVTPDIPALNDKTVEEIAAYLDSQLLKDTHSQSQQRRSSMRTQSQQTKSSSRDGQDKKNVAISDNTQKKVYQSPAADKAWIPLSQSTPMDVPPGAQPKDLLKSRLSKLAQSAQFVDDHDDVSDEGIDVSKSSHLQEDTPSKIRQSHNAIEKAQQQKQREIIQQQEQQQRELKELRDLKHFLLEMPGGAEVVENLGKGSAKSEQFEVFTREVIVRRENEIKAHQAENDKSQKRIEELEAQSKKYLEDLKCEQERVLAAEKEKEDLVSSNNVTLKEANELNTAIDGLKRAEETLSMQNKSLNIEVRRLQQLNKELERDIEERAKSSEREFARLKSINEELKDESNVVKGTNMSLKEMVEVKDKIVADLQSETDLLKTKINALQKEFEEKFAKAQDYYNDLRNASEIEIVQLRGETSEAVTPSKYPELLNKTPCGLPLYDDLELTEVDKLTLTQAHNMIKNVLINLGIPFSKSKQMIPGISLQLQREDILREFVTKTHKLLYNEDMSLDFYMEVDQRGKEHLSQCTSQMFKNLELLYTVLNKAI